MDKFLFYLTISSTIGIYLVNRFVNLGLGNQHSYAIKHLSTGGGYRFPYKIGRSSEIRLPIVKWKMI